MKISVIASTKVGYTISKAEALNFSGKSAGICYWPDSWEKLFAESQDKTDRRVNNNLKSGHHSVFGHVHYNLILEGIPKILAMILNNEGIYNTSEKSARYTKMATTGKENKLYNKWVGIFKKEIAKEYPDFDEKRVLAQENARYLISVFTPATTMEYTVSFEQLNYIVSMFEDFINDEPNTAFNKKVKSAMQEFIYAMPNLIVEDLNPRMKGRKLSLFGTRARTTEFGETYSTTYWASFAQLAQAQRHRTLHYEMRMPSSKCMYYVPPIIRKTDLEDEWLNDISSLKDNFPQGILVRVNERGTIENFVLKCTERLCGAAQLEIMQQTKATMDRYVKAVSKDENLSNYLEPYTKGARCTFPGWVCNSPCVFGGKEAMTRKI